MNRRLIRYKAKPDHADENQRLIEAVFQELRETKPDGVRYLVLRMADDSFAHFVELEGTVNPLQVLELIPQVLWHGRRTGARTAGRERGSGDRRLPHAGEEMIDAASSSTTGTSARDEFDRLLEQLRPKLHRYCARMTGSVIDGEDVLQDALLKAIEAFGAGAPIRNPEGWLFRIAHNAALDLLRARARANSHLGEGDPDMMADSVNPVEDREIVAATLHSFMRLPAAQRSSVILMDVLGYSLDQIEQITAMTVPGIKAALHRGRARLRELAAEPEEKVLPQLGARERALLSAYVDRFNARDVDGFRNLLAEDVRLEVVSRFRRSGTADVGTYISRYAASNDWHLVPGLVEGRPAAMVIDPADASAKPGYFVLIDFSAGHVASIMDFRYARYVMDGAEAVVL